MSLTPKNTFLVTMMIMNTQETVIEIEWQENVLILIRNFIVLKKMLNFGILCVRGCCGQPTQ